MNDEISKFFIKSISVFRLTTIPVTYSGQWTDLAFWVPGSHMSILVNKRL